MSVQADGSVRHEVVVDLGQDDAFKAFDLNRVKPREHTLLEAPIEETVLEPHPGGDLYDRGTDGSRCRWGRVLAFDPPHRIAFTWDIGPDWQVTDDLERSSEVEVTFVPEGEGRTRVTLTHRHIERHAAGWESLRTGLDEQGGWPTYLQRYEAIAHGEDVA